MEGMQGMYKIDYQKIVIFWLFYILKTKHKQFFQLKNRKFNLVKSVTTPEISFLDKY